MDYIFAEGNGREITGKDKIFGISQLAKKAAAEYGKENIVNATIGALLDEYLRAMLSEGLAADGDIQ